MSVTSDLYGGYFVRFVELFGTISLMTCSILPSISEKYLKCGVFANAQSAIAVVVCVCVNSSVLSQIHQSVHKTASGMKKNIG